ITDPAGTVVLDAVVTAPTVNPAFVIAVVAAACVRPTTLGTATCGSPVDTTSATALPVVTCVPLAGVWLITDPAGTVVLDAVVTAPTVKPAFAIAVVAAACVRPTTLGTATCGSPVDTTSATALPVVTCVPLAGVWLITDPAGTVVLDAVVTAPTVKPAFAIAVVAAACVRPTTLGTATCGSPVDTTSATALPVVTCVPPVGVWLITDPAGTVVLDAVVTAPTVKPAFAIAVVAAACVRPTTLGTATCGSPVDTTSATALPVVTCVPLAGVWLITDPAGTVVLDAVVTAPTVKPAFAIAVVAAACVRPTTLGTATCGSPVDTTSATALPVVTCVPLAGVWLITDPAGTVVLDAVVTAPTVKPAFAIAVVAAACVRPTTLGTATCGSPVDTTSATALPVVTCVPLAGVWLITDPAGTVVLDAVVTAPTVNPAFVIAVVAAACVRPTTLGTATCGSPVDTTSATALPVVTCVPATGDWLITEPAGTVVLDAVVTAPTVRPAFAIAVVAAACVRPTTFGVA